MDREVKIPRIVFERIEWRNLSPNAARLLADCYRLSSAREPVPSMANGDTFLLTNETLSYRIAMATFLKAKDDLIRGKFLRQPTADPNLVALRVQHVVT